MPKPIVERIVIEDVVPGFFIHRTGERRQRAVGDAIDGRQIGAVQLDARQLGLLGEKLLRRETERCATPAPRDHREPEPNQAWGMLLSMTGETQRLTRSKAERNRCCPAVVSHFSDTQGEESRDPRPGLAPSRPPAAESRGASRCGQVEPGLWPACIESSRGSGRNCSAPFEGCRQLCGFRTSWKSRSSVARGDSCASGLSN